MEGIGGDALQGDEGLVTSCCCFLVLDNHWEKYGTIQWVPGSLFFLKCPS